MSDDRQWFIDVYMGIETEENFINHFYAEYKQSRKELKIDRHNVEKDAAEMPGILEMRFAQLQEVEALLKDKHLQLDKKVAVITNEIKESGEKITASDKKIIIGGANDVISIKDKINQISLLRNKFAGVIKSLEAKHYQLTNITKLRAAGVSDEEINFDEAPPRESSYDRTTVSGDGETEF